MAALLAAAGFAVPAAAGEAGATGEPSPPAAAAASPPVGQPPATSPGSAATTRGQTQESICLLVESAAVANAIAPEFFLRLIWQESAFRPTAVGPVTRSGQRAQGIAQFMPGTAAERGLLDPFDPVEALPKSAEFLKELNERFGNLGLAAAAYNAGPRRVQDWLEGRGGLPAETRNYVYAITGLDAEDWRPNESGSPARPAPAKSERPFDCAQVTQLLRRQPNSYVDALERRVALSAQKPWGVLLGAGFSRAKVLAAYARIERQHRLVLAQRDPLILRMVYRSRGTKAFFQIRAGVESRRAGDLLCEKLRSQGGACAVLRNSGRISRG
jgi:hypothetical protein